MSLAELKSYKEINRQQNFYLKTKDRNESQVNAFGEKNVLSIKLEIN